MFFFVPFYLFDFLDHIIFECIYLSIFFFTYTRTRITRDKWREQTPRTVEDERAGPGRKNIAGWRLGGGRYIVFEVGFFHFISSTEA